VSFVDEAAATMARASQRIEDLRARNEDLGSALAGLLGLVEMVSHRDDITPELREVLRTNHRFVTANLALVRDSENPL
jgi:hypothetical protein